MTIPELQHVCFIGAGTMGCYNSIVAAICGYEVTVYDVDAETLAKAPVRQAEFAEFLVSNGYCAQDDVPTARQRIRFASDLEAAVADADLVSESIFERLDIKRELHGRLDEACPRGTILTTNTSALRVSDIESAVSRGDRFAALHSHLGAPLVDIVGGPRTSPTTVDILQRYVTSLGGVPLVLKKEHPGYVLNAMLGPLLTTGMLLVSQGEASVEQVDAAWMHFRKAPMGPFGMIDLFGINLVNDSWQYREEDPATAATREAVLALLRPYVESEKLGMKSGQGFYHYPAPAYQQPGFIEGRAETRETVYTALETVWIGNAAVLAALDVAAPADIDMAWRVGTFLEDAPLELLAQIGHDNFLVRLEQQFDAGRFDTAKANILRPFLRAGA